MTALLTLLALACLAGIGIGAGLLRGTARDPLPAGSSWARASAWAATLTGRRAIGFGLAAVAAIAFVVILLVRP